MNNFRESVLGRFLSAFAMLSFLLLQMPATAYAASGAKVTHDALKYFVPEKRIRLEATVVDPKGVKLVRAYFKGKTQADYVFVPMEEQKTVKGSFVATLPALSKTNESLEYLFLVVNDANEVSKTEPFVVKAKDSKDVPSWQMVEGNEPMKLYTEVPNAPSVASTFSDSVSLNVIESGARFGLIATLYSSSGSASASGAAASATNAGMATVATAGMSTAMMIGAAVAVGGAAAAGGGGSDSAPVELTSTTIVGTFSIGGGFPGFTTMSGSWTFNSNGAFSNSLVERSISTGATTPYTGSGTWTLSGTNMSLNDSIGGAFSGTATGNSNSFTLNRSDGYVLTFSR